MGWPSVGDCFSLTDMALCPETDTGPVYTECCGGPSKGHQAAVHGLVAFTPPPSLPTTALTNEAASLLQPRPAPTSSSRYGDGPHSLSTINQHLKTAWSVWLPHKFLAFYTSNVPMSTFLLTWGIKLNCTITSSLSQNERA